MGAVLACLACGSESCCVGSALTCCCCSVPIRKSMVSRGAYFILFCITSFIAFIMSQWAYDLLDWIPVVTECSEDTCYGNIAVFRITFALVLFHLTLGLLLIGVRNSKDFRTAVQDRFWGLKFLVVAILTIICFLIPNSFFDYWAWFSLVGAALFILIQLVLLIDFAHSWSESWVQKMETADDQRGWFGMLLGCTIFMYSVAFTLIVLLYYYFSDNGDCWMNSFFTTIILMSSVIYTVMSVHPKVIEANPRSGLLQSAVVTFYSTYLLWSAIMSEPSNSDFNCNPWKSNKAQETTSLIIGAVFSIVSVCYATTHAAGKGDDLVGYKNPQGVHHLLTGDNVPALHSTPGQTAHSSDEHDDEREGTTYNYSFFHIVFALGYCYIAELLVNWETLGGSGDNLHNVDAGWEAVWIKIVTSWLAVLFYVWTLLAPIALSDRDFGY